jgi:hypothetical protein
LRWRSEEPNVAVYAVSSAAGRLALLLLEGSGGIEESIGPLVRASAIGRKLLGASEPEDLVRAIAGAEPACAVTAAAWDSDRIRICAHGAPVPYLLRFGRPVPFQLTDSGGVQGVALETAKGDVLVIASRGLSALQSAGKPASAEKAIQRLARAAETQTLSAAFANLVSEWKKTGVEPGAEDVLLLAARRL